MLDGHPYLTEELDATRAAQRRVLRQIPDWILSDCGDLLDGIPAPPGNATDRAIVETQLREHAELAQQDVPYHDEFRADLETGALADWAQDISRIEPDSFQAKFRSGTGVAAEEHHVGALPKPQAELPAIRKLASLLAWADLMADDGYRDPRLEAAAPPWSR